MAEEVRLRDGTSALVWPLLPSDGRGLREQYERLSPQARFHRFLAAVPRLTDALLEHLVARVDGVDHVALVLFALPDDGPEVAAGIARMVRYPDAPTDADLAVTVADEWQGRGVATALLEQLLPIRPQGVERIVTCVSTDNPASLAMLRRLGATRTTSVGRGVYDVVVDLTPRA